MGILDEVMDGISAKNNTQTPPPAETRPPSTDPPPVPPTAEKSAFDYGDTFKKEYGEKKT
jgi:hypothetical protein